MLMHGSRDRGGVGHRTARGRGPGRTARRPAPPPARGAKAIATPIGAARHASDRLAVGAAAHARAAGAHGRHARAPRCGAGCCTSRTSRSRPPPGAACSAAPPRPARCGCWRRSRARAGRCSCWPLDGRRIRAQETTLWMTRTALRRHSGHAARSCARSGCCSSPSRPIASISPARRAPRPGQLRTLVDDLPQRRLPVRHRLARARRHQPRRDEPRPQHPRLERGRRRLDAVPALDLAALGRRCVR